MATGGRTKRRTTRGATTKPAPYHHGALKAALLDAAERLLVRDGQAGLTLRAAAREAGVSHAAPINHFDDLRGLLSELAAVGYTRLSATMLATVVEAGPPSAAPALGRGYVRFALGHPSLFRLMFQSERLDFTRPALADASSRAFGLLASELAGERRDKGHGSLTLAEAADITAAWASVHGLATLAIDGRLAPLLARLPEGTRAEDLLGAVGQRTARLRA